MNEDPNGVIMTLIKSLMTLPLPHFALPDPSPVSCYWEDP